MSSMPTFTTTELKEKFILAIHNHARLLGTYCGKEMTIDKFNEIITDTVTQSFITGLNHQEDTE